MYAAGGGQGILTTDIARYMMPVVFLYVLYKLSPSRDDRTYVCMPDKFAVQFDRTAFYATLVQFGQYLVYMHASTSASCVFKLIFTAACSSFPV